MEITVLNRTNTDAAGYAALFAAIAANTEKTLGLADDYQISVTMVRSLTIHGLNKQYRGIDAPTDVISFAARDYVFGESAEEEKDLGDVFINIDYAAKQAREYGHSQKREIGFLFTHGLLHCLGYDHVTPEDEEVMTRLESVILDPIVKRE